MYILWKNSYHGVNYHAHHLTYLPIFFFFGKNTSSTPLANFNYAILSATATILDNRSLDLIHPVTESLYTFTGLSKYPPYPTPWQPPLCFCDFYYLKKTPRIYKYFSVWLISLGLRASMFIHVITNGIVFLFLRINNIQLYIYIYHILFTHLSVDGHSGCFHAYCKKCCNDHADIASR